MANAKLIISKDSNYKDVLTYTPKDVVADVVLSSWTCNLKHGSIQIKDYHGYQVIDIKVDSDNKRLSWKESLR